MDMSGIQSLIQALQGGYQAQPVADLKNQMPLESGGGAPTDMVFTPRGYGQPVEPNAAWIPRKSLDQGLGYNPQIVPDEPIVEKLPAGPPGSAPNYLARKEYRLKREDKDIAKAMSDYLKGVKK